MSNRAKILWILFLCSPFLLSFAGAWACGSPEGDAVEQAIDAFEGCAGFEKPYTEAWLMCMEKMGNGGGLALERCQGFARAQEDMAAQRKKSGEFLNLRRVYCGLMHVAEDGHVDAWQDAVYSHGYRTDFEGTIWTPEEDA